MRRNEKSAAMKLGTAGLLLAAAALSMGSVGCFKHSYTIGSGGNVDGTAKYSAWHSHFLYGIIGEKDVNAKEVCPSGNATVKDEVSFVNGIIGSLVGIIYYPTTVEIYCDGKSASLTIPAATMQAIGRDSATLDVVRALSPEQARELAQALQPVHAERRVASEGAATANTY